MENKIVEKSIRTVNEQTGTVFYTISEEDLNHLYSAGEEVYVKVMCEDELPKEGYYFCGRDDNGFRGYLYYPFFWESGITWWLKRTTRPTVSEEEIEQILNDFKVTSEAIIDTEIHPSVFIGNLAKAIKELNR